MDHGYPVSEDRRCTATTKKQRQCTLPPLVGIELCALHSGLARPNGAAGYGDPEALKAYKRALEAQRQHGPAQSNRAAARPRSGL